MRIGQVNQDNYMEFLKLFKGNNSKALGTILSKGEKSSAANSHDEMVAKYIKMGRVEEGMFFNLDDGDVSWKKIVPVSDDIRDKLIETARKQFMENGNGMSKEGNAEEINAMFKEYRANIPPSERAAATWTLNQIVQTENQRMVDYVKANIPGWKHGDPIDKDILANAVSGNHINIKA